jgi:hypothetical protein
MCFGAPRARIAVPFNGRDAAFGLRFWALEPPRALFVVGEALVGGSVAVAAGAVVWIRSEVLVVGEVVADFFGVFLRLALVVEFSFQTFELLRTPLSELFKLE